MHDKIQHSSSMSILSHHVSNNGTMQELHTFTTTHVLSDHQHMTHASIKQSYTQFMIKLNELQHQDEP